MSEPSLPFASRVLLAWICFFRVLFDGVFAARVADARAAKALAPAPEPEKALPPEAPARREKPAPEEADPRAALQLMSSLQREGRLIDFLMQDVSGFADAEIGAVARVVHDGCRKALDQHVHVVPVRDESEGARLTLEAGFDASALKLTGNVQGKPPHRGTLRHRGWRAETLTLPRLVGDHDPRVLAPAEIEL
jgi:hypothetical protein